MCISCSGADFKDALLNGQERHIKGATAKVKDQDILLLSDSIFLVQAICNGCSCGLIDYAQYLQTCNDTCNTQRTGLEVSTYISTERRG